MGDGDKVWIYDRDLNQVIVRKLDIALGANPAALHRLVKRAAVVAPPSTSSSFMPGAVADAIYGLRMLRSKPGYAAITILTKRSVYTPLQRRRVEFFRLRCEGWRP